ncbi:hypothetical protein C1H46_013831 [Malus baccata]|uniref:WRKY domain-containing protein n=1 Tax=Malus baccata TaxID=106549 RepID=A0A540MP61_MALBA|nr:hypothetical protein C1H46_013831 [Malus baccata]
MSGGNFRSVESPETNNFSDNSNFEFPEYLEISEVLDEDLSSAAPEFSVRNLGFQGNEVNESGTRSSQPGGSSCRGESGISPKRQEATERVAFKTKSEVEILDDGFLWRKYSKKMVKNSPCPRSYYNCAVEGCPVKKRVERDREDPSITCRINKRGNKKNEEERSNVVRGRDRARRESLNGESAKEWEWQERSMKGE